MTEIKVGISRVANALKNYLTQSRQAAKEVVPSELCRLGPPDRIPRLQRCRRQRPAESGVTKHSPGPYDSPRKLGQPD